jgi:DnaJ-class molecular chaperone
MEDYYALLSLDRSADADSIKAAITRELRVWTRRTNAPELEKRQAAERRIKLLQEAESTLLDDTRRARYDRNLASQPVHQGTRSGGDEAGGSDAVQVFVQKAVALVRAGNYPAAISQLKKAATLDPGNTQVQTMLAELKKEWGQILIRQNY